LVQVGVGEAGGCRLGAPPPLPTLGDELGAWLVAVGLGAGLRVRVGVAVTVSCGAGVVCVAGLLPVLVGAWLPVWELVLDRRPALPAGCADGWPPDVTVKTTPEITMTGTAIAQATKSPFRRLAVPRP